MATFNRSYQGRELHDKGPIVPVEISVPAVLALSLVEKGQAVPTSTVGYALIDTGASISGIDQKILQRLGVNPIGPAPDEVFTPTGKGLVYRYPARLSFPGTKLPTINYTSLIGVDTLQQGIVAIIGRDILQHCLFIYNGIGGHISFNLELPEDWR